MSITDELREWAKTLSHWWYGPVKDEYTYTTGTMPLSIDAVRLDSSIIAIADRIDAEHQKALDEWKAKHGQMWLKGYSECHAELLEGNETLASDLERCGWIRLPKDADGEIIHVGDMMERGKARGHVIALMLSEYPKKWGGGLHWGVQLEGEQAPTALDAFFKHYHEPTVEDVLFESLKHFGAVEERTPEVDAWLHEQAKRLKLAGDAS